jgi:hypothetical protein
LLELEGMSLGVAGKQSMWAVMQENYGQDPRLSGVSVSLGELFVRARDQRRTLEELRRLAAAEALK